jgi:hypothetical protein
MPISPILRKLGYVALGGLLGAFVLACGFSLWAITRDEAVPAQPQVAEPAPTRKQALAQFRRRNSCWRPETWRDEQHCAMLQDVAAAESVDPDPGDHEFPTPP